MIRYDPSIYDYIMTDFLLLIKTVILRFSQKNFKDFNSVFSIWLKIERVNKTSSTIKNNINN